MPSVDPFCVEEVKTPLTSSYDGGEGMLSILGLGGASILCRSDIICQIQQMGLLSDPQAEKDAVLIKRVD